MKEHIRNLFPICRSIMGPGARETLDYFDSYFKEFHREVFKTGEKVFDWEIPDEWRISNAYIEHVESDERFCEFSLNNLHVVNYSEKTNKILDLTELQDHLYSLPDKPHLIPYVTSYYNRNWGFCITHEERKRLKPGLYRAYIDSSHYPGELHLSDAVLPGKHNSEILFTSYICHPSMANNELSGPVLVCALLDYVKTKHMERKWNYRFILQPETIGSIAYLSRHHKRMKKNTLMGFNVSCVGDEGAFSYIASPKEDTLADQAIRAAIGKERNLKAYSFLQRGSDERQYCAPGIELPFITFMRSKFGEYDEYHTSGDNLEIISNSALEESLGCLTAIIDAMETCFVPRVTIMCEPQLGKRGLYPTTSELVAGRHPAQTRSDILAYADGMRNIFELSEQLEIELKVVVDEIKKLMEHGLIEDAYNQYGNA